MSDAPDDDATLVARRLTAVGLARTEAAISVGTRLAARTVADERAPSDASSAPGAAELPRISIDGREPVPGTPQASAPTKADLSLVATIGEGGMGRVHLARQRSLERDVALKTLKPGAPANAATALLREARLTGSLEHPGVIPVHALGIDDQGHPMLVMKRVDGVDLAALLADRDHPVWRARRTDPDPLVATLEILSQVCLTLEFAHSRGVIHRDVKPENIMVGAFGEVYLLDWGIAVPKGERERDGDLVGTPVYMAPEMVRGAPVDARTDVYLLGATLHEVLTGRGRHEGRTLPEVMRAALVSAPFAFASDVPAELAALANRATTRDPADRPQTAREMREAIGDYLRHRSARALSDEAIGRLDALERLLATTAPDDPPRDLAEAYRLATEARFGLVQSLREHARHDEALRAMQRCLSLAVELELRQGHADTAETLLREMDTAPPDHTARIAELRRRDAARARDRARLAALDHDLDPATGAGPRTIAAVALCIVVLVTGGTITVYMRGRMGPGAPLAAAVITLSLLGAGVAVFRKRILINAFNTRLVALIGLAGGSFLVNRTIGLLLGRPSSATMATDLLIESVVYGAAAITMLPGVWACSAVTLAGSAAAHAWPEYAVGLFAVTTVLALAIGALVLARAQRKRTGGSISPPPPRTP
jgi:serine/threonine-protein kinase